MSASHPSPPAHGIVRSPPSTALAWLAIPTVTVPACWLGAQELDHARALWRDTADIVISTVHEGSDAGQVALGDVDGDRRGDFALALLEGDEESRVYIFGSEDIYVTGQVGRTTVELGAADARAVWAASDESVEPFLLGLGEFTRSGDPELLVTGSAGSAWIVSAALRYGGDLGELALDRLTSDEFSRYYDWRTAAVATPSWGTGDLPVLAVLWQTQHPGCDHISLYAGGLSDDDELGYVCLDADTWARPFFPGDLDGDGADDILLGVPGTAQAAVYAGPIDGYLDYESAAGFITGGDADPAFGPSEATGIGDCDGDGIGDVAIAAEHGEAADADDPLAWLFLGPIEGNVGAEDAYVRWLGGPAASQGGSDTEAELGAVDVLGDTARELILWNESVGAYVLDCHVEGTLVASRDASLDIPGARLPPTSVGDLDLDGREDLLVLVDPETDDAPQESLESVIFLSSSL